MVDHVFGTSTKINNSNAVLAPTMELFMGDLVDIDQLTSWGLPQIQVMSNDVPCMEIALRCYQM